MNASVAIIESNGGMSAISTVKFTGALQWKGHLNDLIRTQVIDRPGLYITWVWETMACGNCGAHAGVNVALNEVYTISDTGNGELIVEQGIADSTPSTTQKLTTWPPKSSPK